MKESSNLQDWSLTIRWLNVILRTLVSGQFLLLSRGAVGVFYSLSQQGIFVHFNRGNISDIYIIVLLVLNF